jgi:pimeloyl-ACP methyl ester carboxylesterase
VTMDMGGRANPSTLAARSPARIPLRSPMLPAESKIEIRSCLPPDKPAKKGNGNGGKPPLLFVHGGYCDAWCWEPHFLPWFAAAGHAAYALSLRGHGASGGRGSMFVAGLDDYAADVERVMAGLPVAPVLVGHSMGAAVVERLLATRPLRAAALLAPVPPTGLLTLATRLATERPDYIMHMGQMNPARISAQMLGVLRPFYFSDDVAPGILVEAARHLGIESPRALLDLSMRLHWQLPEKGGVPVLVIGAEGDRICTPDEVRATARHHGVEPVILPGLAHMMMLERQWERAARALSAWLATL